MNIKHEKDIKLLSVLKEVCDTIAAVDRDEGYMYVRMADEPYHCDGFPVTAMIGSSVYDYYELFDKKTLAKYLKMIGGMANLRLPLMTTETDEDEPPADEGVDSSEDES